MMGIPGDETVSKMLFCWDPQNNAKERPPCGRKVDSEGRRRYECGGGLEAQPGANLTFHYSEKTKQKQIYGQPKHT